MEDLTKEMVQNLLAKKGEVRGLILKYDGEYVLREKGEEALKAVEEELERLGCPTKYEEFENMSFYPIGMRAISLLVIKKVLKFEDEKIREIGGFHPKVPLSAKLFVKYFYSLPKMIKKVQEMWGEYYTVGKLIFSEYNKEEKYAVLELKEFDIHPVVCRVIEGHLASLAKMVFGSSEIICEETNCTFEGDKSHVFLLRKAK